MQILCLNTETGSCYKYIELGGTIYIAARLAQSVERETLNLKVAGSTPASGSKFFFDYLFIDSYFSHTLA